MIRSMTGFARAEASDARSIVAIEARSVNHRHLEIVFRLPRILVSLEMEARRLVQSRLDRGRVDIAVQLSSTVTTSLQQVRVDHGLARVGVGEARALGLELGLDDDVRLTWVLDRPGVARLEEAEVAEPTLAWPIVAQALNAVIDGLVARRAAEGEVLVAELRALHAELGAMVAHIAERVPSAMARRTERLRERIRTLLDDATLDEGRIATEVAVWAERTDITEELVRLRAHLDQFTLTLDKGGPVGRSFDFLIQELNREVNTVGAKADDLEVSQTVLAAKGVLEKMREQVQNLE